MADPTPKTDPKPEPDNGRAPVPYARFQRQQRELKNALALLDKVASKGLALKDKDGNYTLKLEEATKDADEYRSKYEQLQAQYHVDMALASKGFTHADDRSLIMERWKASAGPGKEPEDFEDWYADMEGKNAEGKAPRWFKSLMQETAPEPTQEKAQEKGSQGKSQFQENRGKPTEVKSEPKVDPKTGKPIEVKSEPPKAPKQVPGNPNNGVVKAPDTKPAFTLQDISQMSMEEYRQHRAGVLEAHRAGTIGHD